jgi:hypothetical protein
MVHVSHFTLIDARRAQSVLFQESQEDPEIAAEVGPNGLIVAWILLASPFLALGHERQADPEMGARRVSAPNP